MSLLDYPPHYNLLSSPPLAETPLPNPSPLSLSSTNPAIPVPPADPRKVKPQSGCPHGATSLISTSSSRSENSPLLLNPLSSLSGRTTSPLVTLHGDAITTTTPILPVVPTAPVPVKLPPPVPRSCQPCHTHRIFGCSHCGPPPPCPCVVTYQQEMKNLAEALLEVRIAAGRYFCWTTRDFEDPDRDEHDITWEEEMAACEEWDEEESEEKGDGDEDSGYDGGDEDYEEGYAHGYAHGCEDRHEYGYKHSYKHSPKTSYKEGYEEGYKAGYEYGYDNGDDSEDDGESEVGVLEQDDDADTGEQKGYVEKQGGVSLLEHGYGPDPANNPEEDDDSEDEEEGGVSLLEHLDPREVGNSGEGDAGEDADEDEPGNNDNGSYDSDNQPGQGEDGSESSKFSNDEEWEAWCRTIYRLHHLTPKLYYAWADLWVREIIQRWFFNTPLGRQIHNELFTEMREAVRVRAARVRLDLELEVEAEESEQFSQAALTSSAMPSSSTGNHASASNGEFPHQHPQHQTAQQHHQRLIQESQQQPSPQSGRYPYDSHGHHHHHHHHHDRECPETVPRQLCGGLWFGAESDFEWFKAGGR